MKMRVWMAKTGDPKSDDFGAFLCWGNGNRGLSMHLGFPVEAEALEYEKFIFRNTKREIMSDISTWHDECRRKYGRGWNEGRAHAVRVSVEWNLIG